MGNQASAPMYPNVNMQWMLAPPAAPGGMPLPQNLKYGEENAFNVQQAPGAVPQQALQSATVAKNGDLRDGKKKTKRVKRKRKPAGAPKHPCSAFFHYAKLHRLSVAGKCEPKRGGMMIRLAKIWRGLSEKEREKYKKLSQLDKERYAREIEEFRARNENQKPPKQSRSGGGSSNRERESVSNNPSPKRGWDRKSQEPKAGTSSQPITMAKAVANSGISHSVPPQMMQFQPASAFPFPNGSRSTPMTSPFPSVPMQRRTQKQGQQRMYPQNPNGVVSQPGMMPPSPFMQSSILPMNNGMMIPAYQRPEMNGYPMNPFQMVMMPNGTMMHTRGVNAMPGFNGRPNLPTQGMPVAPTMAANINPSFQPNMRGGMQRDPRNPVKPTMEGGVKEGAS
eukprot:CAMPEP_0184481828 /NCGR_PEP_ID=MMETSP0113_2-20130426/3417_1 /TAXON_ID=91329 /ORGANISM="Norrisiella sphaerica, Strain BC52" /LENGTH=392 /DNA_ID=CAMNT_0026861223 /DNA_START=230 /DNA_END=1408 /DNA_ORIENTATION=+